MAYSQFTAWAHEFEILGEGVREVIPSCVVEMIREKFPEDSKRGYVGFKEK